MLPIEVPGKLFLIGEYLVLDGGPGILAAVRPGYTAPPQGGGLVHPDSPLGKILRAASIEENEWGNYSLSNSGLGPGFGSSTAELISAVRSLGLDWSMERCLSWFQEHFPNTSGADLAIQWVALDLKQSVFKYSSRGKVESLPQSGLARSIFVFKSPSQQKVKTHESLLIKHEPLDFKLLVEMVNAFQKAWITQDLLGCAVLNDFAEALSSTGRETLFARQVRREFLKIKGVLAAKGCGAGLNDVFLVVLDSVHLQETERELLALAQANQLEALGSLQELLW